MSHLIDLTGQRFGRLVVVEKAKSKKGSTNAFWLCKCDCGKEIITRSTTLRKGQSKSCGCLRSEFHKNALTTHGNCNTRIAHIWYSMKQRCFCATNPAYENYGGRGITVCNEWKCSYKAFYDWAIGNGYADY